MSEENVSKSWSVLEPPIQQRNTLSKHALVTLASCYVVACLLLVLFYAVEDAPWHYSRRVEFAYVVCSMVLIYVGSLVSVGQPWKTLLESYYLATTGTEGTTPPCSGHEFFSLFGLPCSDVWKSTEGDVMLELCLLSMRHFSMLCVMAFLCKRLVESPSVPSLYSDGYRRLRRRHLLACVSRQPVVARWVRELHHIVERSAALRRGPSLAPSQPTTLCILLLAYLMLCNMIVMTPHVWKHVYIVSKLAQWCILLYIVFWLIKSWFVHGQLVDKLLALMQKVVHSDNQEALHFLLGSVDVAALLDVSKDVLELLSRDALERCLLGVPEKALLIFALQTHGLTGSRRKQGAVLRLILDTSSEQLTDLKKLIDGTGTYNNLYKLVYEDISIDSVRSEILAHIAQEARAVRTTTGYVASIKVCSDIDDTFFSSGGSFPSGCDTSVPKGVLYPGCISLFRCLDKSRHPEEPSSNLLFLSARPHVYKSWAESKSYDTFRTLVQQDRMHNMPTMIPGQLGLGLWAMLTYPCLKNLAWRRVGEYKYQCYKKIAKLYLEYDFVFCGDDGQGDVYAGQRMVSNRHSVRVLDEVVLERTDATNEIVEDPEHYEPDDDEEDESHAVAGSSSSENESSSSASSHCSSSSREPVVACSRSGCLVTKEITARSRQGSRCSSAPAMGRTNLGSLWRQAVGLATNPGGLCRASLSFRSNRSRSRVGKRHTGGSGGSLAHGDRRRIVGRARFEEDPADERKKSWIMDHLSEAASAGSHPSVGYEASVVGTKSSEVEFQSRRSITGNTTHGGRMRGVLIHRVLDRSRHSPLTVGPPLTEAIEEELQRARMFFHRTYLGAAVALHQADSQLLSIEDVRQVGLDAIQEFEEMRLMYPEHGKGWNVLEELLTADLIVVQGLLDAAGLQPLRALRSESQVSQVQVEVTSVDSSDELPWAHGRVCAGIGEVRRSTACVTGSG